MGCLLLAPPTKSPSPSLYQAGFVLTGAATGAEGAAGAAAAAAGLKMRAAVLSVTLIMVLAVCSARSPYQAVLQHSRIRGRQQG